MPRIRGKPVAILVDSSVSIQCTELLPKLRPLVEKTIGRIKVAKIVLLQEQAPDCAKEISQEGFLPVIIHDDLDIHFALEAMELVYNEKIHILAIVTENEDFLPLFGRARELGMEVYLIRFNGLNAGIQNSVDGVISLGEEREKTTKN